MDTFKRLYSFYQQITCKIQYLPIPWSLKLFSHYSINRKSKTNKHYCLILICSTISILSYKSFKSGTVEALGIVYLGAQICTLCRSVKLENSLSVPRIQLWDRHNITFKFISFQKEENGRQKGVTSPQRKSKSP